MAGAAVSFLMENISQLLKWKVDLIWGAENELQELKNELGSFKSFLEEAEENPKNDERLFEEKERQMKEVVYEAEDTIDSYLTQAAAAAKGNKYSLGPQHRNLKALGLAEKLRCLREDKVKPMLDKPRMDFAANVQIGDGSGKSQEESRTLLRKDPLIKQDDVVGFEDEEWKLINYLEQETEELDVISITGTPGLGTTTLAGKIFKNQKIEYEFPTRIWVHVSRMFNRREVFLNIVKAFTSLDMTHLSDDDLAQTVNHYLKEEKFLFVMDDVWSVIHWDHIKKVLPKSNPMGKVLITSRHQKVAAYASHTRSPHMLRPLDHEKSWKLLHSEVFGNLYGCPRELKLIGRQIAQRCKGVPFAIVVIGGILAHHCSTPVNRATRNAWTHVANNLFTIYFGNAQQFILRIIRLSYNKLPKHLRDCFLYLGVFPEDYEISAWTLTRLWIAEGLVQHKKGWSFEETAEENLKELINWNLVSIDKTNSSGEVKTCRINNLIRAFCISKAATREHNLFQEIMFRDGRFDRPDSEIQKSRRLCILSHHSEFLSKKINSPHVRSLLCFHKELFILPPEYVSAIPTAFKLLRVLESKSIKFSRFPMKFSKLIHLKFITLSCDNLKVLPEPFSELWNLQTLVLDTDSPSLRIEANIWRIIQLRHLKTKASITLAIQGEGNTTCENLQTLSRLSPEYCTKEVFNRAPNLKRLGIRGKLATFLNDMSNRGLEILSRLENLKLANDLFNEPESEYGLVRLPQSNCFPPFLKRLTLSSTHLHWMDISTLEKINTLEVLKLKNNACTGKTWRIDGHDGFPRLQFLLIANMDLVHWEASTDSFASLRCLVLKNCENLIEIPKGLAKSLKKLEIEHLPKSAVESARKIEEKEGMQQETGKWVQLNLVIGPGCE